MVCNNCGNVVSDDDIFCSKCGTKIAVNGTFSNNNNDYSTEAIVGFALSIASLLFGITLIFPILGIIFCNKGKHSSKANLAKVGKVISIFSLICSIIFIILSLIVITVTVLLGTNTLKETIYKSDTYLEEAVDELDGLEWYESYDLTIRTQNTDGHVTQVKVVLGYSKKDKTALSELKQKTIQIKDELRNYFKNKTGKELQIKDETVLKSEIKNIINSTVLTSFQIQDVRFTEFDVF